MADSTTVGATLAPSDSDGSADGTERTRKETGKAFIRDFVAIAGPFWTTDRRRLAWFLTIGVLALVLTNLAIAVGFNRWNKFFFDALERRDGQSALTGVAIVFGLAAASATCAVLLVHCRMRLQLRWREWLAARLIQRWLSDRRFYQMTIVGGATGNPEFRIADDVRQATTPVVDYGIGLTNAILTAGTFVGILWFVGGSLTLGGVSIPGYMVFAALIYASITTSAIVLVGRPLVHAAAHRNEGEAQFRYELTRVRESAETIALLGGDDSERERLRETFGELAKRWLRVIVQQGRVTWISNSNAALAPVVPLLLGAPKYISGEISLGTLMQIAAAFTQVQSALNYFVDNAVGIADWLASARRVVELDRSMDDLDASIGARGAAGTVVLDASPDENLHLQDVQIATHDGIVMIADAEATIRPGEKVLVKGASGSGKSTLIRAMAGLWPWGSGRVLWPKGTSFLFVPQRPYMPLGTLRDVLVYPKGDRPAADEEIVGALERCGLSHFAGRLDEEANWDQTLSGGEKQRVAFARLLLTKPDIIIMDEATSALDEIGQKHLFGLFRAELVAATVVNVAHRPGIEQYHDREILLVREGAEPAATVERHYSSFGNLLRRLWDRS